MPMGNLINCYMTHFMTYFIFIYLICQVMKSANSDQFLHFSQVEKMPEEHQKQRDSNSHMFAEQYGFKEIVISDESNLSMSEASELNHEGLEFPLKKDSMSQKKKKRSERSDKKQWSLIKEEDEEIDFSIMENLKQFTSTIEGFIQIETKDQQLVERMIEESNYRESRHIKKQNHQSIKLPSKISESFDDYKIISPPKKEKQRGSQLKDKAYESSIHTKPSCVIGEEINLEQSDVFESEVFFQTGVDFKEDIANISKEALILTKFNLPINNLTKIKILPETACKNHYKIKFVQNNDQEYYFGVDLKRQALTFPLHYAWFAKFLNAKLVFLGVSLNGVNEQQVGQVHQNTDNAYMHGTIYKKSKYRKIWQSRYIVINSEGLFSYRNVSESYTFQIRMEDVRYMWTRFDFYEGFLIVKIKHQSLQTEFAIPVLDYCTRHTSNWLFPFYRLMMEHQSHIKNMYY